MVNAANHVVVNQIIGIRTSKPHLKDIDQLLYKADEEH